MSCYGNPGEFVIPDLYESASGDYVMGFGFFDNGLLRVYSNGDSVQYYWRHHPSRRGPRLHHICKTSNDNYVLSYVADFTCLLLEKVDSSGNELWSKFYRYYANSHVIQSDDGEFAIISDKWDEIAGGWLGLVLLKANADGDILWTNVVYQDSIPNYTIRITNKCLTEVSGGGYLILANENGEKIWLFRTDELGDTLWTKKYGGSGIDYGEHFTKTPDGGYIIVGSTESSGAGGSDVWLIKLDSLGNTQWTKTYRRDRG